MYLLDMLTNVERREKTRNQTKKKTRKAERKRATDSKLEQASKKSKFKEASHLPISRARDQLW